MATFEKMSAAEKEAVVNSILREFMEIFENMRIYHWRSCCYGRHNASDKFIGSWIDLTDRFTENLLGHFPALKETLASSSFNLTLRVHRENQAISADEMWKALQKLADKLQSLDNVFQGLTDLLNIRDEIVGQIKQTQYLFTFK